MASESLMEKMRRKLEQLQSQQTKRIEIKEGVNRLRVLPSWRGTGEEDEFFLEVQQHFNVTPDVTYLVCPKTTGQKCPVCARVSKLSLGDSSQQARAERMGARSVFAMNVIPVAEGLEPEVKLYNAPRGVLYELLGFYTDSEYGDFTDPREGFDVLVNRKGRDLATRYTVRLARQPSRIRMPDWKSHLINLDKEFQPKPYEEILQMLGARTTESQNSRTVTPERTRRPTIAPPKRRRNPDLESPDDGDTDIPY